MAILVPQPRGNPAEARPSIGGNAPRADDPAVEFLAAMARDGIRPQFPADVQAALIRVPGCVARFRCEGERDVKGWAVLRFDGRPAGAFGHGKLFAGTGSRAWSLSGPPPTPAEVARWKSAAKAASAARKSVEAAAHAKTAETARTLWQGANGDTAGHPYAVAKRLSGEGLRRDGGALLVPMCDPAGRLWNVQTIRSSGGRPGGCKLFLKNGRTKGLGWRCGELQAGVPLAIGEGMATMAAVRAATGWPVLAAMSAGNLIGAAKAWMSSVFGLRLVFCADVDPSGVGLAAARNAAAAVGATVVLPPRPPGWPDGKAWDFADLWTAPGGAELIRAFTLGPGGERGAR